jgi:hypothetical protein
MRSMTNSTSKPSPPALRRLCVSIPARARFERITALVRMTLGVPIAAVSLVDGETQWFKARLGIEACETPGVVSSATMRQSAQPHGSWPTPRPSPLRQNPLVNGPPHVRSYLGIR